MKLAFFKISNFISKKVQLAIQKVPRISGEDTVRISEVEDLLRIIMKNQLFEGSPEILRDSDGFSTVESGVHKGLYTLIFRIIET